LLFQKLKFWNSLIFHFFQYAFEDIQNYNSLKLVSYKSYTFANEAITLEEIIDLWKSIKNPIEPQVTFPQANSFVRIIDLLSILFEHRLTHEAVTLRYGFDSRQTDYYITACEYLGLVERITVNNESCCQLSRESKHIMMLDYKRKNLTLIKKILERPVFHKAFGVIIEYNRMPGKNEICGIINKSRLSIGQTTIGRRSSTVKSWLDWILRIADYEGYEE
jgi:hypothetical protein